MTDSQLRDLLELGARTDAPAEPPDGFFDRATGRRRRRRLGRVSAGLGVAGAVALGATTVTHGGLPFLDSRPAGPVSVAWAGAPQCVRDVLARANHRALQDQLAVVVVDIPEDKVTITQGISAGTGWSGIHLVEVIRDAPGVTPPDGFSMWDGVTPDLDLAPGRNLVLVALDRSPKPPSADVGSPVWSYDSEGHFPISGDDMTVACLAGDPTSASISWRDSTVTWLGPDAPLKEPIPVVDPAASGASAAATTTP